MANKFDIDPDLVKKIADLLNETGLTEIEFESTGKRIRVAKATTLSTPTEAVSFSTKPTAPLSNEHETAKEPSGTPVTSPMVGTVFLSPEPGAPPFIKIGDTISEGQTVMLIEAMKTYNPVRATKSGKVLQILVKDSTPVEFGEELMLIE